MRPTPSPDGRYLAFVRRAAHDRTLGDRAVREGPASPGEERLAVRWPRPRHAGDLGSPRRVPGHGLDAGQQAASCSGRAAASSESTSHRARCATFRSTSWARARSIAPPRFEVAVAPDQVQAQNDSLCDGRRPTAAASCSKHSVACGCVTLQAAMRSRLTRDDSGAFELFPSWSRDGRQIVFVRWTDAGLGEIHVVSAAGGRPRKSPRLPGHYLRPRFSPKGDARSSFERSTGGQLTSPTWSVDAGDLRDSRRGRRGACDSRNVGRNPHFGASGARVYYTEDAEPAKEKRACS